MKSLHFDIIGGASGDMILGALIDAGLSIESLSNLLSGLNLTEFELKARKVTKNGFSATKVDVLVEKGPPERHLKDIQKIIQNSSLPSTIKEKSLEIFQRIAGVEAGIHNVSINDIHLHELGGTDTIVDICGTLLALDHLGIKNITSSAVPLGAGFIKGSHGEIPLPAPATIALLEGVPVYGRDVQAELVTPTGAALITSLANEFGSAPHLQLEAVGYGAGGRDLPFPNLLRVLIGDSMIDGPGGLEQLLVLETNLDDLSPEIYPYLMERLFEAGALDVILIPVHMKKNRPGTQIQVLTDPGIVNHIKSIIFEETTTLGIRQYQVDRFSLTRRTEQLETPYGPVRIKIADINEGQVKVSPEYEDCARLAKQHQIPLRKIYKLAIDIFWENYQK
jgi:uncharacterized protein (TIGR00299 family) protein